MGRNLIRDEMNGLVRVGRWIFFIGAGILLFIFVMSFQTGCGAQHTAPVKFENRHYGGYAAMQAAQKAEKPAQKAEKPKSSGRHE